MDLGRSAHNLWLLLTEHLVEVTIGMDTDAVTGCVVSAVLIAGGVMLLRVRCFWGVLWIFSVLQWVVFLPEGRYALPLLPLLTVGLLMVFAALTTRLPEPHRGRVRWGLVGLVLAGNLIGVGDEIRDQRAGGSGGGWNSEARAGFYAEYRDGKYAAWVQAAEAVRAETDPTEVVAVPEAIHAETLLDAQWPAGGAGRRCGGAGGCGGVGAGRERRGVGGGAAVIGTGRFGMTRTALKDRGVPGGSGQETLGSIGSVGWVE